MNIALVFVNTSILNDLNWLNKMKVDKFIELKVKKRFLFNVKSNRNRKKKKGSATDYVNLKLNNSFNILIGSALQFCLKL